MNETTGPDDLGVALEELRALTDTAKTVAGSSASTDVVPTVGTATEVKAALAGRRAEIARARSAAVEAQSRARELVEQEKRRLDAMVRSLAAELEPLQEQIKRLEEGIWTVNLYLGRDEEIVTLAEGAPAPAGTPITVRQQVLAMDEESLVAADRGGMDVRDLEAFDRWVVANPENLDQLLPEPRGVVAIIARRAAKDYGDVWTQVNMDALNRHTWWLIRNGENVYRMSTDFEVGNRLTPARNEFTSMFIDRWTKKPLEPGTSGWLKAEKAADARQRHFMRVFLVLQGLVDRTHVFAPLPVPNLSLLTNDHYDAGHVVLLADDEHTLTTGRTPFPQWLAALNARLDVGMRVMVTTRHEDWPARSRDRWSYDHHPRLYPARAEVPATGVPYVIKRAGDAPGSLVFTYARTQKEYIGGWGDQEYRTPKTPASCTIFPSDGFVLPIDLVTVDELETYLSARLERRHYVDMVPVLQAALKVKRDEQAAEAPFRALLAARIAEAENIDLSEAEAAVAPMVDWWKTGNRWHRPLVDAPAAEAKASAAILTERARRVKAAGNATLDELVVARVRAEYPDVLLVARRKDGRFVALVPEPRRFANPTSKEENRWGDQPVALDVWVSVHEFTKTGRPAAVSRWQIPKPAQVSRWIALHESEAWALWNRRARRSEHLTDDELSAACSDVAQALSVEGRVVIAISYSEVRSDDGAFEGPRFRAYTYEPDFDPSLGDRPLTGRRPSLPAESFDASWSRAKDGTVTIAEGRYRYSDRWSNYGPYRAQSDNASPFVPRKDRSLTAPWEADRTALRVVWTDPAEVEKARAQAVAYREAPQAFSGERRIVDTLLASLSDQWEETATAAARARFLEDYLDETLWVEHLGKNPITAPWSPRGRDSKTRAALEWLVSRLVESGRPPYGLTVNEAISLLGEDLIERSAHSSNPFFDKTVAVSPDAAEFRFPDPPPAIEGMR